MYYYGGEQNAYEPNGVVYTMKSRKTTTTERVEIAKRMIDKEMNYKTTAEYHQVLKWVQKICLNGEEALACKKRGVRTIHEINHKYSVKLSLYNTRLNMD